MDSEKCKYVAMADAMKLGEQRRLSPVLLQGVFSDRLAIDGTAHETPEHAFIASLIGGSAGHYTLRDNSHRYGYILSRENQPFWQRQ